MSASPVFWQKKTGHFGAGRTSELPAEQTIRRTLGLLSTNGCFHRLARVGASE